MLLPYPFAGPFDYRVPDGMDPKPGDLVLVPLNSREEVGVVWDGEADRSVGDNRLRPVSSLLDAPPMRPDIRRLVDWIAGYTLAAPGEVLAMALRINALRPDTPPVGWQLLDPLPPGVRLTEQRQRIRAVLADGPRSGADLARAANVGSGVIRAMADAGLIIAGDARRGAGVCATGSRASRPDALAGPAGRCRHPSRARLAPTIRGDAAGRGHRVRQDRSVSGGGRGVPA